MTVIYLFVSPSGRAYAGRHTCQHEGWPRRGSGALPSGYRGSGKLWANVTRRHGPAIRWIILRRFGPDASRADIDAAERRAVRLVRAMWGDGCANLLEGGEGLTSADAAALNADPVVTAKRRAAVKAAWSDPDYRAKISAARKATWSEPDYRAKNLAAMKEVNTTFAQTPERRAFLASIQASTNTPEARAKAAATRARNKGQTA